MFRRDIPHPYLGSKSKQSKQPAESSHLPDSLGFFLLCLLFDPEDMCIPEDHILAVHRFYEFVVCCGDVGVSH